jgi:hypothetical protein
LDETLTLLHIASVVSSLVTAEKPKRRQKEMTAFQYLAGRSNHINTVMHNISFILSVLFTAGH